jgi:hypothetical protein
MPNGRPGDHPLTDIVHHGRTLFGGEADGLVREIAALGGTAELGREPWIWSPPPLAESRVEQLRQLRDRLRGEQRPSGRAGGESAS